jgi:hypothetical protein
VAFQVAVQRCITIGIAWLVCKISSKAVSNQPAHMAILCICDNFIKMRMMEVAAPYVEECRSDPSTLKAKSLDLLISFVALIDKKNGRSSQPFDGMHKFIKKCSEGQRKPRGS